MGHNNLKIETEDTGIQIITINRPNKLNALNLETMDELDSAFHEVYDTKGVKGVIITGAEEKAFVAGADISEIAVLSELNARKFAERGQETLKLIEDCHTPVIAAVNGFALGGGCELAMACHFRLATKNAKFGQPEVNLGVIPGYGGTQRLTKLIGQGKALELMMTGDTVNSEEALQLGLVNYVLETKSEMIAKSVELLLKISKKAPLAIGQVIVCANAALNPEQNGYQLEANSFANCCGTQDFIEGTKAFLEKRSPKFTGN